MKLQKAFWVLALAWSATSLAATAVAPAPAPVEPAAPPISIEYCQTQWQVNGHCDFNYDAPRTITNPTGENYTCSSEAGGVPATKNATCTMSYGVPPAKINDSRTQADNYCASRRPVSLTDTGAVKRHLNQIKCSYKASTDMGPVAEGNLECVPAKSAKDPTWSGEKCAFKK